MKILSVLFTLALYSVLSLSFPLSANAQQDDLSDENWNWANSSPGIEGPNPTRTIQDVVIDGETIYAVGRLNLAGGLEAFSFAIYDGVTDQWDTTPDGPGQGFARTIDRFENRLYLGGDFSQVASESADYMVIWNMDTREWEPFNHGINNQVRQVYIAGNNMFIAGDFSSVDGLEANSIARYSFSSGEWDNMGGGVPQAGDRIQRLASEGDLLYVLGNFPSISGLESSSVAVYNMETEEWSTPGNQAAGTYYDIVFEEESIWFAGSFSAAPDGSQINNLIRYDRVSESFSSSGAVVEIGSSLRSLHLSGDYLYAGGHNWDSVTDDDNIRSFSRFNLVTEEWEPIESADIAISGTYYGITAYRDEILAYGSMPRIRGINSGRIFTYNPENDGIRSLGNGITHEGRVNALYRAGDNIILGGFFINSGNLRADRVASFNPGSRSWNQVNPFPSAVTFNGEVHSLKKHDGYLYVGGNFGTSTATNLNRLARYNLSTGEWEALIPEGQTMGGSIYAFAVHEDNLIFAGGFTSAGGVSGSRIMRYHLPTGSFHPLGDGTNGIIYDIVIHDNYLYAAGAFSQAGGINTGRVARYHLAEEVWESVDNVHPNNDVFSLMVHDNYLYIGGEFTNLVESSARYVAKRNLVSSSEWERAGNTLNSGSGFGVRTIAMLEGTLYIGGVFDSYQGVELNNVARLSEDGESWLPLGSGVNGRVEDFLVWETDLWISGRFTRAGNKPAAGFTVWSLDPDFTPPVNIALDPRNLPESARLDQNYPNPFNPSTTIRYTLPETGHVQLEVYNIAGQRVATLVNSSQAQGVHTVVFDGSRLSSGLYLYRITVNGTSLTRKMMLVK
ncbi:MAG: T9SS type A sorting domain-containing protein [Balneolia bacterium]|nr:T9SS type A sorting domain-containing protein [Balneolia bacterium]